MHMLMLDLDVKRTIYFVCACAIHVVCNSLAFGSKVMVLVVLRLKMLVCITIFTKLNFIRHKFTGSNTFGRYALAKSWMVNCMVYRQHKSQIKDKKRKKGKLCERRGPKKYGIVVCYYARQCFRVFYECFFFI